MVAVLELLQHLSRRQAGIARIHIGESWAHAASTICPAVCGPSEGKSMQSLVSIIRKPDKEVGIKIQRPGLTGAALDLD